MSIETPEVVGADRLKAFLSAQSMTAAGLETALTALFAAATVLLVSFIAVMSGLV